MKREVVAAYRELGRQELERRLQHLADQVSPLRPRKHRPLTLRTELGGVKIVSDYGQDPQTRAWG